MTEPHGYIVQDSRTGGIARGLAVYPRAVFSRAARRGKMRSRIHCKPECNAVSTTTLHDVAMGFCYYYICFVSDITGEMGTN